MSTPEHTGNPTPPAKGSFRPGPHILLAMGFATIIGLLIASYVNINIGENSIVPTRANNIRIDNLNLLKEHITDAENGVLGYVLTRNDGYLKLYEHSLSLLHEDLSNIRKYKASYQPNERALLARLEALIQRRMASLASLLQESSNAQSPAALRDRMSADGDAMNEIRQSRDTLHKLLVERHEKNMAQSLRRLNLMEGVVYFLGISTITLLIVWFATTQRQQRLRNEFDQVLLERTLTLEMQVQKRTEELVALAGYLSNARETEKANLARELHDELGALLTAAKHDASWVERRFPEDTDPAVRERMARLQQNLSSVIGLKRNLINNLRPAMLHDLGLLTALRNLADEFSNATDIQVKADLPDKEINLPEPMALAIFRIVQEAFTNSRKYAHATQLNLEMFDDNGTLILNIYDNGVGFDMDSPTIARHGLAGMKHRVQMLKGKIDITSSPGKGVLIAVEVPIPAPGTMQNRVIADRRQSGLPRI